MLSTLRYYTDYVVAAGAYLYAKFFRRVMAPALTEIEPSTQLSPLVYRILGANPGPFTLRGTNTYLVGNSKSKVLIDTGERNVKAYISELNKVLGENEITCIVCTHWHDDHVGGIPDVLEKVTGRSVPVYKLKRPDAPEDASRYEYIEDGRVITTPGATLRLLATPGHTMDHISLFLEEENALFSGDCILGEGTSIFEDLYTYMLSLNKLLELKPSKIYPGHGPIIENPVEKITEYITHRNARENEILEAIGCKSAITSMDITNAVYQGVPWAVRLGALNNVNHHLSKLMKEQKIEKVGHECYRLLQPKT